MDEFCDTGFAGGSYEGAIARITSFRTIREIGHGGMGRFGFHREIDVLCIAHGEPRCISLIFMRMAQYGLHIQIHAYTKGRPLSRPRFQTFLRC